LCSIRLSAQFVTHLDESGSALARAAEISMRELKNIVGGRI